MKYTSFVQKAGHRQRANKRGFDEDSPSDQSSDSGLELDHQTEVHLERREISKPCSFEEESNPEYCFPIMPGRGRAVGSPPPAPLTAQLSATSRDGRTSLTIVSQPEQQHRARYQTEGSRGAVKDRTGNGFPIVKLTGYDRPTTLQIFVGTDVGRVAPHMFYQACRVSGKNSTPCVERKIEGTVVIEVDLDPSKEMLVTCDCVGILKERNVDVEHRFPDQTATRNKKKSTRCRMVFRTLLQNSDGSLETLQVCSQPIVCTQPPGIPEICKRSLTSCPAAGGLELFILGKNFLKDSRIVFQNVDVHPPWEETVLPDKEFLQQNHLVCVVPPYRNRDITNSVAVKLFVTSGGKASDPHHFVYLPASAGTAPTPMETQPSTSFITSLTSPNAFFNGAHAVANASERLQWPALKPEACDDEDTMMPPPAMAPIRRSSLVQGVEELKTEAMDELSQHSMSVDGESLPPPEMGVDLSMKPFPSMLQPQAYLKSDQFPTLYENEPQQFVDYTSLRPPPSKIQVRDMGSEEETLPRVRSGSFTHSSIHDVSMSGFEAFSRARSASVSHVLVSKTSLFSGNQLLSPSSFASLVSKPPDSAEVKSSIDGSIYLTPPAPTTSESTQAKMLDAIVNSAADAHMPNDNVPVTVTEMSFTRKSPPAYQARQELVSRSPEFYPPFPRSSSETPNFTTSMETSPNSYLRTSPAVAEGFPRAAAPAGTEYPGRAGEMFPLPVTTSSSSGDIFTGGQPQQMTGMLPQDMVKMTDNDLISYINPSAFDQV